VIKLKIFSVVFIISFFIFTSQAYTATILKISPKKFNVGVIVADDYYTGYVERIRGNTILLKDTRNDWKLLVKTNDSDMGIVGSYIKPTKDFYWKAQGNYATQTQYTDITNYDIEVDRGTKSSPFRQVTIDYKILLSWTEDIPGDYNISLIYTLTTQ